MILELRATPEDVMRGVEALQQFGREHQLDERVIFSLALAVEECGSNIVNHSLGRDCRKKFRLSAERRGNAVRIELRDAGPEFDPTGMGEPEPSAVPEERPPGGWGIQLVRKHMDEVRYGRENGENVLRLTKRLPRANSQK